MTKSKRRRAHWYRCQQCGGAQSVRDLDGYGETHQPRKPCKTCRHPSIDFHYIGFVVDPDDPGPQRGPASVPQINAQAKQAARELSQTGEA